MPPRHRRGSNNVYSGPGVPPFGLHRRASICRLAMRRGSKIPLAYGSRLRRGKRHLPDKLQIVGLLPLSSENLNKAYFFKLSIKLSAFNTVKRGITNKPDTAAIKKLSISVITACITPFKPPQNI